MFELSKEEKAEIRKIAVQNFELNFFEFRFYEKLGNLFHWKGEIEFPPMFETLLRLYGSIGYSLTDKTWYVGIWDGRTDELGRPIGYCGHKLSTNHEAKNFKIGEDFILCWNNSLHASDAPIIEWYCELLKEGDKSLKCQLLNSRFAPIIMATNDNMKDQINKAVKSIYEGKPFVVSTDMIQDAKTLDILDPAMVDKLQYLTSFSEEIKKRLYGEFGIEIKNEDKRAQVSVEELKKEEDLISLNYLSYYEARLKFVEEMKAAGIDISVTPSPIYASEPTEEEIEDPEVLEEESEATEENGSERKEEEIKESEEGDDEQKEN